MIFKRIEAIVYPFPGNDKFPRYLYLYNTGLLLSGMVARR